MCLNLGLDHPSQQLTRPGPRHIGQWIIRKRSWLAKPNDCIVLHGVSLSSESRRPRIARVRRPHSSSPRFSHSSQIAETHACPTPIAPSNHPEPRSKAAKADKSTGPRLTTSAPDQKNTAYNDFINKIRQEETFRYMCGKAKKSRW